MVTVTASATMAASVKPSDVKATLHADTTTITPGTPFTIAIVLTTQPDWHIYWQNPGDAGSPTKFNFHLPEGFKVETAEFPLPTKFTQPGDIVAYGYTGTTVFLATITPPKNLPAGEQVKLAVDASWLCCKSVCVPGSAKLSLELPAATDKPHPANEDLFQKARAQIPAASPPEEIIEHAEPAKTQAGQKGLLLTWKKPPRSPIEVFPLTPDDLVLSDLTADTQGLQTTLS